MRGSSNGAIRNRTSRLALVALVALFALALSACDWTTFRHDNAHTGFVPLGDGPADAAALTTRFTVTTGGPVFSSAAIVNGVAYVGSLDGFLYAFDATGQTNCAGSPIDCAPLWRGATPSGFQIYSSPAVDHGIVYVGSDDGLVYAFDADGNINCSGAPRTCTPLFADQTTSNVRSSPVVANGVLYIGSVHNTIEVFDANGTTNCSGVPKVCAPLWTGTAPGILGEQLSVPALANGLVYVGARDGTLYAFDAAGVSGCSGAPKVCAPVWIAPTTFGAGMRSSPAVSNGIVYVGADDGSLNAYDAAGFTNCSSASPRVCTPVWAAHFRFSISSSPAIANGMLYIATSDGVVAAFDAAGSLGCSGAPKECQPLWVSQASGGQNFLSSPAVANGVVYIGSFHDVDAFDASTGAPITHITTPGFVQSSPAIANGMVFVGSGDGKVYALG
jgi:outer membrane protein assembly factor BamB